MELKEKLLASKENFLPDTALLSNERSSITSCMELIQLLDSSTTLLEETLINLNSLGANENSESLMSSPSLLVSGIAMI